MPEAEFYDKPRFCSRCGLPIVVDGAGFCKECGAPLNASGIIASEGGMRSVAAFLLSIIPGLGHVYQGRVGRGVMWFVGVAVAYGAGPIGYLVHLICAVNAASYGSNRYHDRRRRRRDRRRDRQMDRAPAQF